jgi:hypothetical protein
LLLGDSREEIFARQQQIEKQGFLQHLNAQPGSAAQQSAKRR